MAISIEAKAIQALCNDIDALGKQADAITARMLKAHKDFYAEMLVSSNEQRAILAKIGSAQDAIAQLQYKNWVPKNYDSLDRYGC